MIKTAFLGCVLGAGLLAGATPPAVTLAAAQGQAATQVTAADAAPFLGDWTLTLQGPNGPGTFELSVKAEGDKVAGEISSDQMAKQAITEVTKADKSLVLAYSFTWEGNAVDAVVSLTPGADAKTAAQIDFAGGAYVMTGTATKKEKAK